MLVICDHSQGTVTTRNNLVNVNYRHTQFITDEHAVPNPAAATQLTIGCAQHKATDIHHGMQQDSTM